MTEAAHDRAAAPTSGVHWGGATLWQWPSPQGTGAGAYDLTVDATRLELPPAFRPPAGDGPGVRLLVNTRLRQRSRAWALVAGADGRLAVAPSAGARRRGSVVGPITGVLWPDRGRKREA